MIRVSVLYANEAGKKFDHDYYKNRHMRLVGDRLKDAGLIRYEVDKGVAGGAPGSPAPFLGACHLYFNSISDFQKRDGRTRQGASRRRPELYEHRPPNPDQRDRVLT